MKAQFIYEPLIAYGVAEKITSLYYAWIDFTAENKYGKDVYTIELLPNGVVASLDVITDASYSVYGDNDRFEIYDMKGTCIGIVEDLSYLSRIAYRGLLIIKQIRNGSVINTIKMMR